MTSSAPPGKIQESAFPPGAFTNLTKKPSQRQVPDLGKLLPLGQDIQLPSEPGWMRTEAAKGGGASAGFQTHTWPDADCTAHSRGATLPRPPVPEKQVT